ncbi:electron transport complex subunit RsxE [Desulfohalovibrio reitneri]|uniref:electron transport complex subunit RsxE n=1 Tax=Desulfohalovibrio reitneri TaxID=1307759 RepID=UPI00068A1A50|nr:electron transport complex subunit E [Desulfohalovibrio reitneri]
MNRLWKEFSKGLWRDLPPFKIVLGLCPVLAVTKSASNGLGMGVAVIFVLTLANIIVSSLRKLIPAKVRIAAYIVIIATLVVTVEQLMQAFSYPLYQRLGIFVPLIVVNCLILGRAEAFAARNPVHLAAADGLGMGVGFAASLTVLGGLRELLGAGSLFGAAVMPASFEPFAFMIEAPGAFVSLGLMLAAMNVIGRLEGRAPAQHGGCATCAGACYRREGVEEMEAGGLPPGLEDFRKEKQES